MAYVTQNFYSGQKLTDEHMKHIEAGISTADANATKALDIAQKDHATLPPEIAGKADNWMIEEETGLAYLTSGGKKISSGIMIPNDGSGVGGSGSAGTPYAVQYVFQKLTDEQKEQARENIGAGNAGQINVKKYGISTDGTNAAATTAGINQALSDAKAEGHMSVVFPQGEYLVDKDNAIIVDGMVVDFNGSTIRKEANNSESYSIVELTGDGGKILNAVIYGDRETHDFGTSGTHEWGVGVSVKAEAKFAEIENVKIFDTTGYGIGTSSNFGNYGSARSIKAGKYNETTGVLEDSTEFTVLEDAFDVDTATHDVIALTGDGYANTGIKEPLYYYMTYYDAEDNFLGKSAPYRFYDYVNLDAVKYVYPALRYIRFTLNNADTTTTPKILIRSAYTPDFITIKDVEIGRCRTLGIAICGGKFMEMSNVEIYNIGGAAPGYAVDVEDGYKVIQRIKMEKCYFHDNRVGNITVSGAREVLVDNSTLQSTVSYQNGADMGYSSIGMSSSTTATNFVVTNCNIIGGNTGGKDVVFRNCNLIKANSLTGTFVECNILESAFSALGGLKLYSCRIERSYFSCRDGDIIMDNCDFVACVDMIEMSYINQADVESKVISIRSCRFYESDAFGVNSWPCELIEFVNNYIENLTAQNFKGIFGVNSLAKKARVVISGNVVNSAGRTAAISVNDTHGSDIIIENNKMNILGTAQVYERISVKTTGSVVIRNNTIKTGTQNGTGYYVMALNGGTTAVVTDNVFLGDYRNAMKIENTTQTIVNNNVYKTGTAVLPEGVIGTDLTV